MNQSPISPRQLQQILDELLCQRGVDTDPDNYMVQEFNDGPALVFDAQVYIDGGLEIDGQVWTDREAAMSSVATLFASIGLTVDCQALHPEANYFAIRFISAPDDFIPPEVSEEEDEMW